MAVFFADLKEALTIKITDKTEEPDTPKPQDPTDPTPTDPTPSNPPKPVTVIEEIEVIDAEKSQWYTNLWYRMNGSDESNRIRIKEGMEDNYEYYRKHLLEAMNTQKDEFKQAYKVLDPHFATSKSWLADVLSQGIVVMSRIQNDEINTANKYKWNEIIHTDAAELTIESDQDAIARAEAQYEQTMHEIQTKDKRFQLEINKLDSEHNALQTQIESIRSEIAKNIERSFKTFS